MCWVLFDQPFDDVHLLQGHLNRVTVLRSARGIRNPKLKYTKLHSGKSFFPKTSVTIVIFFWLEWAGYLAVAGLNLLAQLSDRRSPYGVYNLMPGDLYT